MCESDRPTHALSPHGITPDMVQEGMDYFDRWDAKYGN
jgi:hypothetical protein